MKRKSKGSLIDFVAVLFTVLAMAIVVMAFFNLSELLLVRMDVSQISRKYILRMETKGYLDVQDKENLLMELEEVGLMQIDLSGSTTIPVSYGEEINLCIQGRLSGSIAEVSEEWPIGFRQRTYDVEEKRMSTAKN